MLRVFVDTIEKEESIYKENVNIQYLSLINKVKNKENFKRFKDYLNKCLNDSDYIIVLTKVDLKLSFKNENIKIFVIPLSSSGMELVVNQIVYYKDESLPVIESRIQSFLELFEALYYSIVGV